MGNSKGWAEMRWLGGLFRKGLDAHEQKCVDDVCEYGCHIMQISAEDENPQFSYSVGFPVSTGQPEVIVFGLKQQLMHSMINEIRRQCVDGLIMLDGTRVSNLLEGFDCILRHVTDWKAIKEHFGWAIWYHRTQRRSELVEAYQIVWPGAQQGLFQWDEGCDNSVISQQPSLYVTSLNS
jgi:hypothetical protein